MAREKTHPRSRRGRRKRRGQGDKGRLAVLVVLGVIVLFGVVGYVAFDDRHWRAFDDAGDVAFERGNYAYAERMYTQALQVAEELDDRQLIVASLQALSRAYAAQERPAAAAEAVRRAQQVRSR